MQGKAGILVAGMAVEAEGQRVVGGKNPEGGQGLGHRHRRPCDEGPQRRLGSGHGHPGPGQQHRLAGGPERLDEGGDGGGIGGGRGRRGDKADIGSGLGLAALHVHGQIDHHRPRPPGGGEGEGFGQQGAEIAGGEGLEHRLGDGAHQGAGVHLLEAALAQLRRALEIGGADLSGQHDHGNAVIPGVGDAGDDVGHPRPRRDQSHRRPVAETGAGEGGIAGPLLVAQADAADAGPPESVDHRSDRAAGKEKDGIEPGGAHRLSH